MNHKDYGNINVIGRNMSTDIPVISISQVGD